MRFSPRAAALLAAFLFPALAWAGGAIKTDINGLPLRWEGTVVYNPDKGGLKNDNPTYNHANTVQIMNDAFSSWITLLPEVGGGLTFSEGAGIPESGSDVNASNFGQFLGVGTEACYDDSPDTVCTSPILFDADGEIIDSLFGSCSKFSILGFAGFDDIEDGSGDPDKAVVRRGAVAEGPWMLKRKGVYYLMYSGSGADGPDYAIGYATSKSPLGPFTKHAGNPIAKRGNGVFGPGHHCVITGPDGKLYFGVGCATNCGVVGADNFAYEWLPNLNPRGL
ncbi:hypothetical protein FBR05_10095, partial [Deltaproteobacteria bacterium PRO3]|nr:hypothetical protein [Deltaproteobacteria bacterium PRO3]